MLNVSRRIVAALLCSTTIASNQIAIASPTVPVAKQKPPQLLLAQAGDRDYCINQVENNTRQILLKLIELEKFNLNYHVNVAKQGRWKGWRYFITQEGNNLISLGGCTTGMVERVSKFNSNRRLHRNTLETGNALGMAGQLTGAGGSSVEFLINGYHEIEARRKGYGPKAAKEKVLAIRNEIDTLLLERQKLMNNLQSVCTDTKYIALARAEEPVLIDIRDISLDEFKQFHLHLRRALAFQQSLYLGDVARNVVGAFGNRQGWRANKTGNRTSNTSAGILFEISGVITMLNPLVSRGVGKLAEKYEARRIRPCMDGVNPADVEKLAADLERVRLIANSPELERADLPLIRSAMYSQHEVGVRKQIHIEEAQERAGVLTAAENVFSGTLIGSTKIASGVLFHIAGLKYYNNNRETNIFLGVAGIVGAVGLTYGTAETARIQIKRELQYQRAKKKHELPGQIMKDRMAKLEEMEKSLQAPTPISFVPHSAQDAEPDMRM
ncbi:MAG: hypothetical protein SFY67_12595 [Candidatus Melainabacteria bacterium]|nr:hypothetical protein [Candidatus Melainabacteria bacterium]